MEVENKLLPCAHCGSPAEEELTVTELSIRCVKCGVKLVRDAADELLAFQDWNTRAQDPDPDPADFEAVCIDGVISINGQGHLPCNHCEKAIERYIAQNVRTVTTTGADPDLIERDDQEQGAAALNQALNDYKLHNGEITKPEHRGFIFGFTAGWNARGDKKKWQISSK